MSTTKDGDYYQALADLAAQVKERKGEVVYRNKMDAVSANLPSKQVQNSTMGIKLKRKELADERAKLTKRRSTIGTIKLNQVDPDHTKAHDEMKKRGLKVSSIHTLEDQIKMLDMIRAVPRPMAVKLSMKHDYLEESHSTVPPSSHNQTDYQTKSQSK